MAGGFGGFFWGGGPPPAEGEAPSNVDLGMSVCVYTLNPKTLACCPFSRPQSRLQLLLPHWCTAVNILWGRWSAGAELQAVFYFISGLPFLFASGVGAQVGA